MKIKKISDTRVIEPSDYSGGQLVECDFGTGWKIGVVAYNCSAGCRQWCNLDGGEWMPLDSSSTEYRLAEGTYEVSN